MLRAEWLILMPALAAGALVCSTHVLLGREVLARGILFLDLALAQVAATGVVAAQRLGLPADGLGLATQGAALLCALCAAALLAWTERHMRSAQEALIGALFVTAASVAVLLMAGDPQGGEHLTALLAGQILWVTRGELLVALVVTLAVLGTWALGLRRAAFYPLFALSVTLSVQLVGVYLVFATLVIPALAARAWPGPGGLVGAYVHAALGYLVGLAAALWLDAPPGPAIVLALAVLGVPFAWHGWRRDGHTAAYVPP